MADETAEPVEQSGARFPFIPLERAIRRAKDIYKNAGDHPVPVMDAARLWGYGDKASGWRQTIAALKYYGLIDDFGAKDARKIKLTSEARRYMLDERPEQHAKLNAFFALKPRALSALWTKWGASPPNDAIARSTLKLDFDYAEAAASQLLAIYKANLVFADLANLVPNSSPDQPEQPDPATAATLSAAPQKEVANMQTEAVHTAPISQSGGATRQDTCNLPEGVVVLSFPERFSEESYADLEAWLDFQKNRLRRWVTKNEGIN